MPSKKVPNHWRIAVVAAVIGTLIGWIAFVPASWLAQGVWAATSGRVLLADAQGSMWDGSAQLYLTAGADANDAAGLPGRMHWRLSPSLQGANMLVQLPCCSPKTMTLGVSLGWNRMGLQLGTASINLPAQWLSGLGAPWNTLDLRGQLTVSTTGLQMNWFDGRMSVQGAAQLDLLDMSSRLSTLSPLGDYRVQLVGGDVPQMTLQTLRGPLQLSGSGQIVGSRLRFRGEGSASQDSEAALGNVLNIIGRRQGARSLISMG